MRPRDVATSALLCGLEVWAGLLSAEGLRKLTLESLYGEVPLVRPLPTEPRWHPDGQRVSFLREAGESTTLLARDARSGAVSTVLGPGRLKSLKGYRWFPDGKSLLVPSQGDLFLVDPAGAVRPLTRTPEEEELSELSPDGKRVSFVRKGDLYVVEVASGREVRLTSSGSDTVLNGRLGWVYEEELAGRTTGGYWWSPDSRAVAFLQLDESRVPTFPLVDFLPVHNSVLGQRYPKAGDPGPVVRAAWWALPRTASRVPSGSSPLRPTTRTSPPT